MNPDRRSAQLAAVIGTVLACYASSATAIEFEFEFELASQGSYRATAAPWPSKYRSAGQAAARASNTTTAVCRRWTAPALIQRHRCAEERGSLSGRRARDARCQLQLTASG